MVQTRSQKLQASSSTLGVRKRSKRRPSSKTKCNICQQLLDILLARNKQSTTELGSPQSVIAHSTCQTCRKLFVNYFQVDLATTTIKSIKVYRNPRKRDIELTAVIPEAFPGTNDYHSTSVGWGLVTNKTLTHPDGKILLINSKWVDINQVRRWKEMCDKTHPSWCGAAYRIKSLASVGPQWLIDCWRNCIVAAGENDSYVALSYVWGAVSMYRSTKANFEALQQPGALKISNVNSQIPASIRHAIALTPLLRERYLWIDSLCIVQDDDRSKHTEIQKMAGIYNNATFTIILQYDNADHGIPGIRGVSEERQYQQELFQLGRGYQMTRAIWAKSSYNDSMWSTRAWTFQEGLLASRRLTFRDQTVQWDCYCGGRVFEDFNSTTSDFDYAGESRFREAILEPFPDMCRLGELIEAYNDRALTYPEDAHDAFSSLLASMSASFHGGFIFGLPIMNLDVGLLWQPSNTIKLRQNRDTAKPTLPSWSWVAWQGEIDKWSWYKANDYVKKSPRGWALEGAHLSERTIPLVEWSAFEIDKSEKPKIIPLDNIWLGARERLLIEDNGDLPEGWSRFEYTARPGDFNGNYYCPDHGVKLKWYYKHEASHEAEFWYPVPMPPVDSNLTLRTYLHIISCRTWRVWLYGAEQISEYAESTIALRTESGQWAGCLQLHEPLTDSVDHQSGVIGPRNHSMVGVSFELVRVSIGYNFEDLELSNGLTEWKCPERPKISNAAYVYYNVLWIIWKDDIAYRRGIGRVPRRIWDEQQAEEITLILG